MRKPQREENAQCNAEQHNSEWCDGERDDDHELLYIARGLYITGDWRRTRAKEHTMNRLVSSFIGTLISVASTSFAPHNRNDVRTNIFVSAMHS